METTITAHPPRVAEQADIADKGVVRGALGLTVVALAGFGFLYAMAGVGVGQALFPAAATGSLVEHGGKVIGSSLVAQPFVSDRYFQPRPSAAGYNAMSLAGSNHARTNADLRRRLEEARTAVARREGVDPEAVPGDLVTQSGGGADPHISPEGAALQVARVARARGLPRDAVERLVAQHTEARQLGILGQPRVNVLHLNLALDALAAGVGREAAILPGSGR